MAPTLEELFRLGGELIFAQAEIDEIFHTSDGEIPIPQDLVEEKKSAEAKFKAVFDRYIDSRVTEALQRSEKSK